MSSNVQTLVPTRVEKVLMEQALAFAMGTHDRLHQEGGCLVATFVEKVLVMKAVGPVDKESGQGGPLTHEEYQYVVGTISDAIEDEGNDDYELRTVLGTLIQCSTCKLYFADKGVPLVKPSFRQARP